MSEPEGGAIRFEDLVKELEAVVLRLERGDQSLESSLADFERGMKISKEAAEILGRAEATVDRLLEERDGSTREVPFEPEGE